MEPSLQPSFTFPSRKDYANRALGLQKLINTQLVTTVPKRATDISIETGLQSLLTVPKTLNKDVIDVKSVLPIVTPIYVQPGLAEGMKNTTLLYDGEQTIVRLLSANNALKRGNYKSAEFTIGRPLTAQEIQNQTITPDTREDESNPNVKVHVGQRTDNIGTKTKSGNSHHVNGLNFNADIPHQFLIDLAFHYGVSVPELLKLKTRFGWLGDSIPAQNDYLKLDPKRRDEMVQTFVREISSHQNKTQAEKEYEDQLRRNLEGSDTREQHVSAQHRRDMYNSDIPDMSNDMRGPSSSPIEQLNNGELQFHHIENIVGPAYSGLDNLINGQASVQVQDNIPMDLIPVAPSIGPRLINPGDIGLFRDKSERANVNHQDEVRMLIDSEDLSNRRNNLKPVNPNMITTIQPKNDLLDQLRERMGQRRQQIDNETEMRVDMLNAATPVMDRELAVPAYVLPMPSSSNEANASRVLNARAGRGASLDMQDELNRIEHESNENWTDEEIGSGIGRKRKSGGRIGMDSITHPHKRRSAKGHDDRWLPEADGIFRGGAPVSGMLMKKTGTNAIPISAQIQVKNNHQLYEQPIQRYTEFPNMTEEIKDERIEFKGKKLIPIKTLPIGKTRFGRYMLDHSKLINGGILSLSHAHNGRKIHGLPNTKLTPGTHHAITQIMTGGKVNPKKLTNLDKTFMTSLLRKSHANVPQLGSDVNVSPEKQLSLILGEMEAGNDSKELKSQLKKILPYMKQNKILTAGHIADIKEHYLK